MIVRLPKGATEAQARELAYEWSCRADTKYISGYVDYTRDCQWYLTDEWYNDVLGCDAEGFVDCSHPHAWWERRFGVGCL